MAELTVRLELSLSPRFARWGLAAALLTCPVAELGSETVTLTTYYPAPSGVYTRMITTNDTFLARDTGRVGVGTTNVTNLGKLVIKQDGGGATNGITLRDSVDGSSFQIYQNGGGRLGFAFNGTNKVAIHGNGVSIGDNQYANAPATANSLFVENRIVALGRVFAGLANTSHPNGTNFFLESAGGIRVRQTGCFSARVAVNTSGFCGGGYYVTNQAGVYSEISSAMLFQSGTTPVPSQIDVICCPCGGSCVQD